MTVAVTLLSRNRLIKKQVNILVEKARGLNKKMKEKKENNRNVGSRHND